MNTSKSVQKKSAAKKTILKKTTLKKTVPKKSSPKKVATRMPASAVANQTEAVEALLKSLKHPFKSEIEAVRAIILASSSKLKERVKWAAPSFFLEQDFAAFNLHAKGFAQLILLFPNGLTKSGKGLLEGEWKDRRMAMFTGMADVKAKKPILEKVIREWVKLA